MHSRTVHEQPLRNIVLLLWPPLCHSYSPIRRRRHHDPRLQRECWHAQTRCCMCVFTVLSLMSLITRWLSCDDFTIILKTYFSNNQNNNNTNDGVLCAVSREHLECRSCIRLLRPPCEFSRQSEPHVLDLDSCEITIASTLVCVARAKQLWPSSRTDESNLWPCQRSMHVTFTKPLKQMNEHSTSKAN